MNDEVLWGVLMRWFYRAKLLRAVIAGVLCFVVYLSNFVGFTQAQIAPDTSLEERQNLSLARVGGMLVSLRSYNDSDDRKNCNDLGKDGLGLVARLELNRRGLLGGVTVAKAEGWVRHIAEQIARLVGTGERPKDGACYWQNEGSPAPMQAAAGIAYALHRYGNTWSSATKKAIRVAVEDSNWVTVGHFLVNGRFDIVAAELLAGEALGRASLFESGVVHLDAIFNRVMEHGGFEVNTPLYSAQHFPPLIFLQELKDVRTRSLSRILLDYELLFHAHSYLPGGGFGAPQMRDYAGGASDKTHGSRALLPVLWLLIGDPEVPVDVVGGAFMYVVSAATDYKVPEVIRSVFLDKEQGYTSWTYTDAQQDNASTPQAVYNLGLGGVQAIPWQTVMLPGGQASLGMSYGYRLTPLYVSSGVYMHDPAGGYAIHYQYQPVVTGDTDDAGISRIISDVGSVNNNPDDFIGELYDYERLVYGRTGISLWDPTVKNKPPGVVRTHQDTRVHLPNFKSRGGESTRAGKWYVGRLGTTYLAYYPLGKLVKEVAKVPPKDSRFEGPWTYLRLDGPSGGIVELATTDEFSTLKSYANNLASRNIRFSPDPLWVEADARNPDTGKLARVRLEYRPERRIINGVQVSVESALKHGLIESPWVSWDEGKRRLNVARNCYGSIVYDWKNATVSEVSPQAGCNDTKRVAPEPPKKLIMN